SGRRDVDDAAHERVAFRRLLHRELRPAPKNVRNATVVVRIHVLYQRDREREAVWEAAQDGGRRRQASGRRSYGNQMENLRGIVGGTSLRHGLTSVVNPTTPSRPLGPLRTILAGILSCREMSSLSAGRAVASKRSSSWSELSPRRCRRQCSLSFTSVPTRRANCPQF